MRFIIKISAVFVVCMALIACLIYPVKANTQDLSGIGVTLEWGKIWRGGYEYAQAMGVAIDEAGYIYVIGYAKNSSTHDEDILLMKFNESGDIIWNKTYGGLGNQEGMALTTDKTNNIYAVGDDYNANSGLILAYNSKGDLLWKNNTAMSFYDITLANNSIYACGVDSSSNAALVRYNLHGNLTMNKKYNLGMWTVLNSVSISNNQSIYCSGAYNNTGDPTPHVLLIKTNSSGDLVWKHTWGGSKMDTAGHILLDDINQTLYLAGTTESYSSTIEDVLLLRYNISSNLFKYNTWSTNSDDTGGDQAFSPNGNIYITGTTGSIGDCVLLKCGKKGNFQGNINWTAGTDYVNIGRGIAINKSGMIYVTGNTGYLSSTEYLFLLKYKEDVVPEFVTIILPAITIIAIFIVVTKRRKKEEQRPRA